jgi:hypothetical protein
LILRRSTSDAQADEFLSHRAIIAPQELGNQLVRIEGGIPQQLGHYKVLELLQIRTVACVDSGAFLEHARCTVFRKVLQVFAKNVIVGKGIQQITEVRDVVPTVSPQPNMDHTRTCIIHIKPGAHAGWRGAAKHNAHPDSFGEFAPAPEHTVEIRIAWVCQRRSGVALDVTEPYDDIWLGFGDSRR